MIELTKKKSTAQPNRDAYFEYDHIAKHPSTRTLLHPVAMALTLKRSASPTFPNWLKTIKIFAQTLKWFKLLPSPDQLTAGGIRLPKNYRPT